MSGSECDLVMRPLWIKYPFHSAVELGSFHHLISLEQRVSAKWALLREKGLFLR